MREEDKDGAVLLMYNMIAWKIRRVSYERMKDGCTMESMADV